jgi:gliding motility-associated-like protein
VSDSAKLTVLVQNRPRVNAGPELTLCTNGAGDTLRATVLSGQAPGSLIWSWTPITGLNNATLPNPVANPTATTVYNVRVTDPLTGCSNSASDPEASVLVRRSTRPVANAGPDRAICLGDSAQLGDFGQNLGVDVRYLWSPALGLSDTTAQFPKASPPISTRYFLRVISDGCESIADEVRVEVVSSPTVVINQNVQEICPGESTQLTTQIVNGRPPYTYTWWPTVGLDDPTSASPKARPTVSTWYFVRATATACVNPAVDSVLVQVAPGLTLEADSTNSPGGVILCQGESVELPARITSAFPAPVTWSPATGLSNPNVLRPIASPTITTAYIVSTTLGRCVYSDTVTVNVVPNIVASVIADSTRLCDGQSTLLRATGGIGSATYRWSPTTGLDRSTGPIVRARPNQTTLYTVTASEGGCEDTDSVLVEVFGNVTSNFRQSYARGCDSTLLVSFEELSVGAVAWLWDFGDGTTPSNSRNPIHLYEAPGIYFPRLRAFANPVCSDDFVSPTPVIVTEGPVASFTTLPPIDSTLRLPIAELQLQDASQPGVVSWFWQFGDGTISREQNPVKRYNGLGDYFITLFVTDSVGCTDSIVQGPFRVRESWLDIPNVFTPNGDGLNDRWQVPYNGPERYKLAVVDRWGYAVHTANSPNQPWDGRLPNGENAADGVYYFVLEIGENLYKGSVTLVR